MWHGPLERSFALARATWKTPAGLAVFGMYNNLF
jgi:hypothetical protein